ncbi:hypothetical protein FD723_24245 [Nostoc sp. C052]|nr:hypothetical protein FD723_24245 [Nostoc sp. C052]
MCDNSSGNYLNRFRYWVWGIGHWEVWGGVWEEREAKFSSPSSPSSPHTPHTPSSPQSPLPTFNDVVEIN